MLRGLVKVNLTENLNLIGSEVECCSSGSNTIGDRTVLYAHRPGMSLGGQKLTNSTHDGNQCNFSSIRLGHGVQHNFHGLCSPVCGSHESHILGGILQ